jgi:hypothetical protein
VRELLALLGPNALMMLFRAIHAPKKTQQWAQAASDGTGAAAKVPIAKYKRDADSRA